MSNNYYVYGLVRPDTIELFYVGMSCKEERIQQHIYERKYKKSHKNGIICKCIDKLGFKQIPHVVFAKDLSHEGAAALEIELINFFGRFHLGGILSNNVSGGEGWSDPNPETRLSHKLNTIRALADPSVRAKMSAKAKARDRTGEWEQNRKESARTPEVRAKMSAAKKGKTSSFKGYKHSEESIVKAKASHSGKIWITNGESARKILATEEIPVGWTRGRGSFSEEHKLSLSRAHLGKKNSEKSKRKNGAAHLGKKRNGFNSNWWKSPEGLAHSAKLAEMARERHARNRLMKDLH